MARPQRKIKPKLIPIEEARSKQDDADEAVQIMIQWRLNPVKFVEEVLGINGINRDENGRILKVSNQQRAGLKAIGDIAMAKDVVDQYKCGLRTEKPSDEIYELSKKLGVSIMSGKGTGKDAFASWVILWMLCTHYGPKILCTAPTQHQLKQVLWAEVAMWHGKTDFTGRKLFIFNDKIAVEGEKIYMKGVADENSKTEKDGKYWSAVYRTPQRNVDKVQMAKTLSGLHARNMMFVLDEASGIDDSVFGDLENTMTGAVNFALLIFNPHKASGFAYETHYGKHKHQWITLQWDAEESDLVDKKIILSLEEKYGRESDNFIVNVKGLPPRGGSDSFIPYEWIYAAYNRDLMIIPNQKVIIGIDVARGGTDYTVVTARVGGVVFKPFKIVPDDFHTQCDVIGRIINDDIGDYEVGRICVDASGLGHGLYDILSRRFTGLCSAVKVAESPRNPARFRKLRDELWWKMRDKFEAGTIQITAYKELVEELHCVGYSSTSGKIIVDNKDKIIKKLGRSCDFADSLMLTFFADDDYSQGGGSGNSQSKYKQGHRISYEPVMVKGFMYV